jgi:hypothetical protein
MLTCNNCINDTPDSQNWESATPLNLYSFSHNLGGAS